MQIPRRYSSLREEQNAPRNDSEGEFCILLEDIQADVQEFLRVATKISDQETSVSG